MKIGDIVEDFTLPDENGEARSLSKLVADGPVVLFFYPLASSGGCTKESCHFRDLATEFTEAGAQRIGISPDSVDKQKEFSSANNFDYPLLSDADGTVAKQFGVRRSFGPLKTKRHTFVIGTDRKLIDVIRSEFKFELHADKALETLRANKS